jgi:serine/threonine-protein kinase
MTAPQAEDPLDELLAACLAAEDPTSALDRAAAAHPQHAARLRERYAFLCRNGAAAPPAGARDTLGPFRIGEPLGGGGMGVVYAAVDQRSMQAAALKVVRPEWLWFPGARERFAREIAAVAQLDDPGIVRVLAHDVHAEVPWYAMELVAGRSLAAVLGAHRGADPGRLPAAALRQHAPDWASACIQVACQVARALAHAHAHGIVHRDVKPSNVMLGDDGRARLIDFGLAAVATAESLTRTGVQPGSLAYMSPEQARGEPVDARTDVWSLGVLLYELLTLHQPFVRATEAATREAILAASVPSLRAFGAAFDDALAAIVATAMAPEPQRRYQSMAAFAADLRACQAREPVAARRPSPLLRARRWLQRHPGRAAGMLSAILVLGVLPLLLLWREHAARARIEAEAQRARTAEQVATTNARTSRRVVQFLQDLFYEAEPGQSRGGKAPIRVLLERGVRRIRAELGEEPLVRAELLDTLGSVLATLGLCVDAEPLLRESLQLRATAGVTTAAQLATSERLAQVLSHQERHAEAEVLRRELAAAHARNGDATATALTMVGVAGDLWRQDRVDDAQTTFDAAIAELTGLLPADDLRLLRARRERAAFLLARVQPAPALAELRLVHERLAAQLAADDPTLLQTTEILAAAEIDQDQPGPAEQRLRAAEATAAAVFDAEHPILAALRVQLALALHALGRHPEGLRFLQQALAAYRTTHGDDHPLVARTRHVESQLAFESGDLALAAAAAQHALRVYERTAAEGSHDFALLLGSLARVETLLGRPAVARSLAQRALAMHERIDGGRSPRCAMTLAYLAYAEAIFGELDAALVHAREATELARQGANARVRFHATTYLADILLIAEACEEAQAAIASASREREHLGSDTGQATLLALGGWLRYQQQDLEGAERDLLAALALQEHYGANHPYRARSLGLLGAVLLAQQRIAEAIACLQESVAIRRAAGTDLFAVFPLLQLARAQQQAGDDQAAWDNAQAALAILGRDGVPATRLSKPALQLLTALALRSPNREVRSQRNASLLAAVRTFLPKDDAMRKLVERVAGER